MAFQFRKTEDKEKQETFVERAFTLKNEFSLSNASSEEVSAERSVARQVPTVLSQGSFLEGTFTFEDPACIEGTLIGNVTSCSTLLVSETALVEANAIVDKLVVYGSLEGNVDASDLVEIFPGASVKGDIKTSRLIVHDGGFLIGKVEKQ